MIGHPLLQSIAARLDQLVPLCSAPENAPGILVGFSGGPDSLALLLGAHLWCQQKTGRVVEAAHLHHELRPVDADDDLAFCHNRCAELGIVLHEFRQDPRPVAKRRGQGIEEASRHLRRILLQDQIQRSEHLHCLALGHHRDDQIETILMRLFRGTGPDGMRGILPVQGHILRPMLEISRRDIISCLEELGETWRVDTSNLEGDNLRARLRREVIPVLDGAFGPGAHAQPLHLSNLMTRDLELLTGLTQDALAVIGVPDHPERIQREKLLALDPALAGRALHAWLVQGASSPGKGGKVPDTISRVHVEAALAWIGYGQSGTRLDLPGGVHLERVFQEISIVDENTPGPILRNAADYRIDVEVSPVPADPVAMGRAEENGVPVDGGWCLNCPASALKGNLRVGHFQPGDKILLLGLEGSKKLSDLLLARRIPVDQRSGILVVRDDEGIVWVVGIARSERTRLLPDTDKIVTINVIERHPESKRGN